MMSPFLGDEDQPRTVSEGAGPVDLLIPLHFVVCIAGLEDEKTRGFVIGDKAVGRTRPDGR